MLIFSFSSTRHNLKILGLLSSDSGMFQCVGMNNAGSVQASAFLEVIPIGNFSLFSFTFRFNLELIIVFCFTLFSFVLLLHSFPLHAGYHNFILFSRLNHLLCA